jgi:hypothetical protein
MRHADTVSDGGEGRADRAAIQIAAASWGNVVRGRLSTKAKRCGDARSQGYGESKRRPRSARLRSSKRRTYGH